MDVTENNIPENENSDLYKIAYNIVPDGADYDVFSENTKTVNPALLYNDIPSERAENVQKSPQAEQKEKIGQDSGGMDYDVFSENADLNPAPAKPINREYLDRLYKDGIEMSEDTILMTRSDYIAEYNRINEYYDAEKQKCKKNFLWSAIITAFGVAVAYFLRVLLTSFEINMVTQYLFRILFGLRLGAITATLVVSFFFLTSSIKSIKNAEKSRQKSIDRLEQRKQELMILGLYDLSN